MRNLYLLPIMLGFFLITDAYAKECSPLVMTYECVKPFGKNECQVGKGKPQGWEGSPCEKLYEEGAGLDSSNLHQMACINMGAVYESGECKWINDNGDKIVFEEYLEYRINKYGSRNISGGKSAKDCNNLGGIVVTVEEDKEICLFHSNACPSGWSNYNGYKTSLAGTCDFSIERGNGVNDSAWNACTSSAKIKEKCGHHRPAQGGGGAWGPGNSNSETYNTILRVCYAGSCGDHKCYSNTFGNTWIDCSYSGSQQRVCTGTIIQIGCI